MKLNVKNLSYILVLINSLVLFSELPFKLIALTWSLIALSFFVKNNLARNFIKVFFLAGSLILLKLHFKTFLVTEAGVAFVLILSALKLWELDQESDHFNMFLILALMEACFFLLAPTFSNFFLGLLKIVLFFYFILKIRNYDLSLINGKRLLILVAPSLFLALFLFYTFPRFTSGFINTSNPQMLFSGSDSQINFKKLGPLNLSSKVVFRVFGLSANNFPHPLLYWRESILWDLKKDEWKTGYMKLKSEQPLTPNPLASYRVQLEKDYNEFLPVLDGVSHIVKSTLDYKFYSEGSFRLKNITRSSVNYEVDTSYTNRWTTLSAVMERKGLRLMSNKRDEIMAKISNGRYLADDDSKFKSVESFFKSRNFEYSLSPPTYNSLEDFILNGKLGYCSHFAAAFAYISRAAGLPARIISGYQGGEYNPFDQSVIVREQDAHAWVEIYFKDRGWVRYDPTAMVAPGRIQLGSFAFHEKLEPYLNLYYYKLPKSFLRFQLLEQTSLWLDSMNSSLSNSVLNFDKERQQQLLNKFLPTQIAPGFVFALGLALSLSGLWFLFKLLWKNKKNAREIRYQKFIIEMRRKGLHKNHDETASAFSIKCCEALPEKSPYIQTETAAYINAFYRA